MSTVIQGERLSSSILISFSSRVRFNTRTSLCKRNTRSFSAHQPKNGLAAVTLSNATSEGLAPFFPLLLFLTRCNETVADYLSIHREINRSTTLSLNEHQSNHCRASRHVPQSSSPTLDYSLVAQARSHLILSAK